jgi:hypothetical protein
MFLHQADGAHWHSPGLALQAPSSNDMAFAHSTALPRLWDINRTGTAGLKQPY